MSRADILWSVNKLAREVTKGQSLVTNAWRVWSRTFIIQVNNGNIVMWETQHKNADLDCFKTLILQETLKTQNQPQEEFCASLAVTRFVPKSWMRKKQTSVSHSSTEAEIISLDAGLRIDGIPALALWDLVIDVFHSVPNRTDGHKREPRGNPSAVVKPFLHNTIPIKHTNVIPTNIDYIPCHRKKSDSSAMLYVFEDNEAVIKMIITGCCPTRRHVSRTHRVALDWLFDRINLDPKNQIRYIDTKHQLADILTKGSFTRDEWNNLLHLFNVSQRLCQVFSDLLVLKQVQQEAIPLFSNAVCVPIFCYSYVFRSSVRLHPGSCRH